MGTGTNTGKCYWEKNACESFTANQYNTYKIRARSFDTEIIRETAECVGEQELLANDAEEYRCGKLCFEQEGCEYFASGASLP